MSDAKTRLLEYGQLKIQANEIEAKLEFLKEQCLKDVLEIRGDADQPIALQELPGYKFSIMKRKTWTYPDYVKEAEKNLKAEKKDAEATGAATFTETEHLLFTSPKAE